MKPSINIGLVGYRGIGRVHSLCYQELRYLYPDAPFVPRLYAVCTSARESAEAARAEAGFERAYHSVAEMLADSAVDVVDVTTPNHLHRAVVEQALAAGKHVYCEKPLAATVADARAIATAVSGQGAHVPRLGMVFQYRFIPALQRAHALISEGALGQVYTFRAEYLHTGYQDPQRPLTWRLRKEQGGSGALGDLGSHVIDLVRFLLGDFAAVQGHLETFIKHRPLPAAANVPDGFHGATSAAVTVDDVAWLNVKLSGGGVGSIEASRFATGTLEDLRIWMYGERGALRFDLMDSNFLYWYDERSPGGAYGGERGWKRIDALQNYPGARVPPARTPLGWTRAHAENQYRFLRAIHEGAQPNPGVIDGLKTQLIIDAVERSHAAGGGWIAVERE